MFLKNRNIISKIIGSKVTDYAALTQNLPDKDGNGSEQILTQNLPDKTKMVRNTVEFSDRIKRAI